MISKYFYRCINSLYSLSDTKLLIVGNQKSGTTAIAKLLSDCIQEKVLLDSPLLWEPHFSKVKKGSLSLKTIIESNKIYFSKSIVKEPNLTFFLDEVIDIYPATVKYLFIVRDPRDNIRSLLDRVRLPGDLSNINDHIGHFTIHERVLFDKKVMGYTSDHYIEKLSQRWNQSISNYEKNKSNITLVKYEDFVKDKVAFIENLALNLGFKPMSDIAAKTEIQYQPKGNSNIDWLDFYGKKNLMKIQHHCSHFMSKLGYY